MSIWLNPVDRLPWIRQDWGTHLFYGAAIAAIVTALAAVNGLGAWAHADPTRAGLLVSLVLSCAKKVPDYWHYRRGDLGEGEPLGVCVAKGLLSPLWAYGFWMCAHLL